MNVNMNGFLAYHNGVTNSVVSKFKRYLFEDIYWSESSITLIGERGVGKTTMLIQYAKANFDDGKWIYLSGDFFQLQSVGLFNFVSFYFNTYDSEAIIIDEIHKYQEWKVELKNVLDAFPNKKILVSGSSAIHLLKTKTTTTDLERRRALYELRGMSLREYLNLKYGTDFQKLNLSEVVSSHCKISLEISSNVEKLPKSSGILKEYYQYIEEGYYPFAFAEKGTYKSRILRTSKVRWQSPHFARS